jgi:hypothetical protein
MLNAENEHVENENDNVNTTYGGVSTVAGGQEWTQKGIVDCVACVHNMRQYLILIKITK